MTLGSLSQIIRRTGGSTRVQGGTETVRREAAQGRVIQAGEGQGMAVQRKDSV